MRFIIVFFYMIFIMEVYAKEIKWHTLKDIDTYSSSNYNLKDDVLALEIRTYGFSNNYKKSKNITIGIYVKPLESIKSKLVKKFRNASPNFTREGNIRNPPDFKGDINRAFVIKKNGDVLRMNEISDVIGFLGTIDRPAEAYLIWWMHSMYSGTKDTKNWKSAYRPLIINRKYRQTSQGYEIIIKYIISRSYSKKNELCNSEQNFTDKIIVDKRGNIIYFKQLHKSKVKSECSKINCGGPPITHKKDMKGKE